MPPRSKLFEFGRGFWIEFASDQSQLGQEFPPGRVKRRFSSNASFFIWSFFTPGPPNSFFIDSVQKDKGKIFWAINPFKDPKNL